MKLSTLTLLLGLSSPISCSPFLKRQSQPWNDKYIKKPSSFTVTQIEGCTYQLTFQRDTFDSRYSLAFSVQHGSSSRSINPISGGLPISSRSQNLPPFRYDLGTGFDLSVHQFKDACANGASGKAPTSFKVFNDLDESGYTYRNDWWSDAIVPSTSRVPAVPQSVRAIKISNGDINVTWQSVQGATGYFVLVDGRTYASELGGDVRSLSTLRVAGSEAVVSSKRKAVAVAVVARGAAGIVSASGSVPVVNI
ncbi:hypothetical protein FH972_025554 [Carpinus fangiana]|uniref:Uncharacterized protein n=1 Tax=Carpinus fangiana TaxID=176857 RepID=A0A5N6L1S3_9ROSI|nr:hypothetical protein FH972_025554 [Carpinus fangiana]